MTESTKSPAEVLGAAADLRDRFAIAALTGMNVGSDWDESYYARRSYEIADAMLAYRQASRRGGEA